MNDKLRKKIQWIDLHKEFNVPFTNKLFQFEIVKSDSNAVKHITPGLGYTRRKNVCFAIVLFVWNKRILFRLIKDPSKADKYFRWRKQIK